MEELKIDELRQVDGGFELGLGTVTLITLGVPFIIGIIDGLVRPPACN